MPHNWTTAENIAALYLSRRYGNKGFENDPIAIRLISHGISIGSLRMALGNYLSLYSESSLDHTSRAQRSVFLAYGSITATKLQTIANKALKQAHFNIASHTIEHKRKYARPKFLSSVVNQETYTRWLQRKARAHVKRDRKRGNAEITNEAYRIAIHDAVSASKGRDAYTGERLAWTLISKYDNDSSKAGARKYKAEFALLPTVDHVSDGKGRPAFKICSWRTNSAKSDLMFREFLKLCKRVVSYSHKRPHE